MKLTADAINGNHEPTGKCAVLAARLCGVRIALAGEAGLNQGRVATA